MSYHCGLDADDNRYKLLVMDEPVMVHDTHTRRRSDMQ